MLKVKVEIGSALRKILKLAYGLEKNHLKAAIKAIKYLVNVDVQDAEIIDDLSFDDAVFICANLEKAGFKAGYDYGVYLCGFNYGLIFSDKCLKLVKRALTVLAKIKVVRIISLRILKEWRHKFGKRIGDVYEALDMAYRVVIERDKLNYKKCPNCGSISGAIIKEYIQEGNYVLHAKRICCNYREEVIIKPQTSW